MTHSYSPELALVDPALAEVLRAFLPEPTDCLAGRLPPMPRAIAELPTYFPEPAAASMPHPVSFASAADQAQTIASATAVAELESLASRPAAGLPEAPAPAWPWETARARRVRHYVALVATWLVAFGVLAVPLLAFVPASEGDRPRFLSAPTETGTVAPRRAAADAGGEPRASRAAVGAAGTPPASRAAADTGKKEGGSARAVKVEPKPKPRSTRHGQKDAARTAKRPASPPRRPAPAAPRASDVGSARGSRNGAGPAKQRGKPRADSTAAAVRSARRPPSGTPKRTQPVGQPRAHHLDWRAIGNADLYNVVLVRGSKRVDRWVKTNRLSLPARTAPLPSRPAVEYRWYVYPLFQKADGDGFRFGQLVARGVVALGRGTLHDTGT